MLLLDTIADLLCPLIVTTNYDLLLSQNIHIPKRWEAATWHEGANLQAAIKNGHTILHLHGVYNNPSSVILGSDDYQKLLEDEAYKSILKSLWLQNTLLFYWMQS